MFVYLNQVMQTSCGSLPMGSLSRGGAGIALIKPHHGRPWDAQFILWHDILFLALSPEIRFDFFLYFYTEFVSYSVFQGCIFSFNVQ